jgi:hypothetical protein
MLHYCLKYSLNKSYGERNYNNRVNPVITVLTQSLFRPSENTSSILFECFAAMLLVALGLGNSLPHGISLGYDQIV